MRSDKGLALPFLIALLVLSLMAGSCTSYEENEKNWPDTFKRGTIHISADESFKPIIDAQVQVYESNQPDAKIIVHYKPEAECLKDFIVDSIRMIIATRGFTKGEGNFIADSLKLEPKQMVVARDAVVVIVNPLSPDSLFTMEELKQILTGRFNKKLIPVFDGVKATSTVRFIVDSVLKNDSLAPGTMAARTSEGVIDYVAKNPEAIGFIGVSWIGNKDDATQRNFLQKVKIARLESTDRPGGFVLPYQDNIFMGIYPMVRDLVYTLKEKHKGLGEGFSDFLAGEKGQMIFRRAYLVPAQRDFTVRKAELRE
ncbi:MAG TPA: substrate-binding domain-containing protein [Chitinophagaceae bacterium]|nr:substrate-binding domain-containing protein [Chitinophagaceae bacterium]